MCLKATDAFLASYLVIIVAIIPIILIVTYVLSVTLGHVKPLFPYISYTGNCPPESCLFTLAFNLGSVVYLMIAYLRFCQVLEVAGRTEADEKTKKRTRRCNITSLVFGILAAVGLSVIGSFQQRLFRLIHVTGVFICTFGSHVFFACQTYFSFTLLSGSTSVVLKGLRLALVIAASFIQLTGPVFSTYTAIAHPSAQAQLVRAEPHKGDYVYDIAAALECLLLVIYIIYLASFYPDLRKIVLEKDKITFNE